MAILHSKILGSGTPLLILHGYFGMSDNWKTLGTKFSEDFEVHLIDQRNHGRSFHADDFSYELLAEDLYRYIEFHKLEKVNLLGHSMGGKTVMLFAVEHSELVHKLIVADISPRYYKPHHDLILEGLNAIDFSVQTSRKLVDEKLAEYIPEFGIRQFLLKSVYWREKGQLDFRFHLKSLTTTNNNIGTALPPFTSFEGETLFLKGGNSDYITEKEEPIITTHFPNSDITIIPDVGHWLHAEKPIDFYKIAIEFLKEGF